jgi:hypothetical protein
MLATRPAGHLEAKLDNNPRRRLGKAQGAQL